MQDLELSPTVNRRGEFTVNLGLECSIYFTFLTILAIMTSIFNI